MPIGVLSSYIDDEKGQILIKKEGSSTIKFLNKWYINPSFRAFCTIQLIAFEHLEVHLLIKGLSIGILLINIHILDTNPSENYWSTDFLK